jgi:N-acetylmuramoyl-L-alanine amidase
MRTIGPVMLLLVQTWAASGTATAGGRQVPTRMIGRVEYVALADVAKALQGKYWCVEGRFVAVLPGEPGREGDEYVFRPDSAAVLHSGRQVRLASPTILDGSQLCIPVVALADLFPSPSAPALRSIAGIAQGDTLVLTVTATRLGAGDRLTALVDGRSSLECRVSLGASSDAAFAAKVGALSAARPGILKSLAVDTGAGTILHLVFSQPAARRQQATRDGVELRIWPRPQRRIARIVLDPGHGGKDPGALGRRGTEEKGIVLDVARRLRTKLAAKGYEIVMARDSDKIVTLGERSQVANTRKADMLVSIHANSAPNRGACGLETYFLSEAKTDWERAVAARENGSLDPAGSDTGPNVGGDLGLILADLAQNEFLLESSELAARIQEAAVPCARAKDRGVRQANFFVLRNTYMPAVLVECGFLSNKAEEKLLRKPEYRDQLAEGICRGIVAFAQQYERKVNGS